ncbi:hypothetical protein DM02DRAFT_517753 [Periconia macrospinosa]|uniref:polynucleotide adenylyltransferase n=1 Tax=Periconia macrospinosa TaxID=97972 RepID=A0A2V1E3B9_9PLEO|nr:hypothetical protein DM02DRAFT_517753 [Periconia macrospinosa]
MSACHPYEDHHLPIHSDHSKPRERVPVARQSAAFLRPYPHIQYSLNPLLQPANLSSLLSLPPLWAAVPSSSPSPPFSNVHSTQSPPTVTVSPHRQSPTSERDPPRPTVAKKSTPKSAPASRQLDGNKGAESSTVPTSTPPMTSKTMGSKREDLGPSYASRLQRPSIVSHHSNSVPSTPVQNARQYESRSRSPSPSGGLGSHSPRSVASEANSTMPTLRPPGRTVRCPYETNVANGRRRVPYVLSDPLPAPKDEPKLALDPQEDDKLTGDMRAMYDRLQPSKENTQRRDELVAKLQRILETEFPGNEFKVHVFGSSGNMLYTSESDVDVCIQTPMTKLEEMHGLAAALAKHGMERVVCIPQAKVRIVKIWDPVLKLACDMNVNNTLALENTRLIKTYVQIDERVRQLGMIVKYWTKQRILNDAAFGGTISSYTWICMILNFLQTRDPPIIPSLHKHPHKAAADPATGKPKSDFADDLSQLVGFGEKNKESLGQLLFHFFRRYGYEIDYEKSVVSVREGCLLPRETKNWHRAGLQKEALNRLCVEEPFNTERNLGNSADDYSWRGIHVELRRAFDLLADGQQLEKSCEQYEFPPEEKSSTPLFKKPQPTKTTLTSSVPIRSGRGGGGHRGGRGNYKGGNGSYGRRASSGASFNRPPFLNSPPIPTMPGQQDYFQRDYPRGLNEQLHDQLSLQYQMLEMQSNSLRQHLAAQQRAQHAQQAQQAQHVQAAQMHAQAVAHAQAQQHGRGATSTGGSPQKSPYLNGRSSPHLADAMLPASAFPHGFLYPYAAFFDPTQANQPMSQDGSRTNPSSPSLTNSVPTLRRQVHRPSNASDAGSLRSHSQPPRGLPAQGVIPGYPPIPQYYDPSAFVGYPIARSTTQEAPASSPPTVTEAPVPASQVPNYPEVQPPSEDVPPKEYVGYYLDEPPTPRPLQEYAVSQIPSFSELAQRRRRVSSEITQPLLNTALRRVSRSPSPLGGHMRSYSSNVALPSSGKTEPRKERTDSARLPLDNGPVIVNGSYPVASHESRTRSGTVDSIPSADVAGLPPVGMYANPEQYRMVDPQERKDLAVNEIKQQKPEEILEPSIVNGSMNGFSPMDLNGLSQSVGGGQQAFPTLPEGWMNYNLSNGNAAERSEEVSPTRVPPQQWRPAPYGNGMTALDTINTPRTVPQEVKSATLPLLSPVFETRTPSPTLSRQAHPNKTTNGTKGQAKENNNHNRRASHSPAQASAPKDNRNNHPKGGAQANEKNNGNNNANNKATASNNNNNNSNSNTWQHPGPKGKRKKKGGNKANENKTSGEPLPANAADRKGG